VGRSVALRLGAIRPTQVRLEPPVVGELLERGVPLDAPLPGGLTHRARAVVQVLAGVASKVLERALVSHWMTTDMCCAYAPERGDF